MDTKKQDGFTLIELVVVIVILGILAATALPKFIDLRQEAANAATAGVAGALNSAFAINYGAFLAAGTAKAVQLSAAAQACNGTQVTAANGIMQGGLPSGYSMSTNTVNCSAAGVNTTCTVSGQQASTATVTLICTG